LEASVRLFFRRRLWRRYELLEWGLARGIFFMIVLAAARFDFLPFVFNCWFAPALMVGVTLGLFFDYLPHRPFQSRNRWHNARVYPGRLMNWLIMGQNYHLIHHLWLCAWIRVASTCFVCARIRKPQLNEHPNAVGNDVELQSS
jgi:fatty acid desaturase